MAKKAEFRDVKEIIDYAWMKLDNIENIDAKGPLYKGIFDDRDDVVPMPLLETMSNPDYFYFLAKHILGIRLFPFQTVVLQELWHRPFPMFIATRGGTKTSSLAIYSILRALLVQGSKIVICGAGFRQSKLVFDYCEKIWYDSPILRDICGNIGDQGPKHSPDMFKMTIGSSTIIAVPIGNGEKIRGLRSTDLITDEFASIPRDVFEIVMGGFNAVVPSPFDSMVNESKREKLIELGRLAEAANIDTTPINKSIIAGTAYYQFNHFYDYYTKWKKIIESKGNVNRLGELYPDGIPKEFDWRHFSIIRLPFDILPNGVMDKQNIAKARASTHNTNFLLEYAAIFANDSNGFFKRKVIESCVVKEETLHCFPPGTDLFRPTIKGNPNSTYVYGVDPASEADNFSITILELRNNHRRIVYQWTTNKKKHRDILAKNMTKELDYYAYCTRKIRDLMRKFPCAGIAMDSQGGGYTILESLHDSDKRMMDEEPIWEIIVPDKEKHTDGMHGLHIVELINFASSDWTTKANHDMNKDFEDKALIFPFFDSIMLEEAGIIDNKSGQEYDTLEDCVLEIEELKNELSSIIHTKTLTAGRDRWDTPEIKLAGNKKGRMRKDRYSSLLMANAVARCFQRTPAQIPYTTVGGFANQIGSRNKSRGSGPAWYAEWANKSRIYN